MVWWKILILAWPITGIMGGVLEIVSMALHPVRRKNLTPLFLTQGAVLCVLFGPLQWAAMAFNLLAGKQIILPYKSGCIACEVAHETNLRQWSRAAVAQFVAISTVAGIESTSIEEASRTLCQGHRNMLIESQRELGRMADDADTSPGIPDPLVRAAMELAEEPAVEPVHYWKNHGVMPAAFDGTHYACGIVIEYPRHGSCNWNNITCPNCLKAKPQDTAEAS